MMNRRDALRLGSLLALGAAVSAPLYAKSKPMRILILGGTGFIGPHFVEVLKAQGHTLTLFNRGKRNPQLFSDVETLLGDRNGQIDALKGRKWDVVIDNSGYVPRHVRLSAELLKDSVQQYVFVSSISAYADLRSAGIDEDYPVAKLEDPNTEEINGETYGGLKALCEQAVEQTFGDRATILRPTYIVGPGDPTDRFTYWPARVARGGEVLAPGAPSDPIQFIDVRDLADFTRLCVEGAIAGRYNVCNPPRAVTMGQLLDVSKQVSRSDARFVWANAEFLEKHQVLEKGEIPIWAPPAGEYAGAALVSCERAQSRGLRFRSVETTVADTLAWHAQRPAEQREKMRAGLPAARESELLQMLKGAPPSEGDPVRGSI